MTITEFLKLTPIPGNETLTISRVLIDIAILILIFLAANVFIWFLKRLIKQYLGKSERFDEGRRFAIYQISKYIVYAIAVSIVFDRLQIGSLVFTSLAGLLVGIGFGLQQTFNNLMSGLQLLFEGTVKVGDIVEVENLRGRLTKIGVRTSSIQTRDDIVLVVPNSFLTTDKVINWSDKNNATRFHVKVGVAYGSPVELVKKQLLSSVEEMPDVVSYPEPPLVLFKNFGDSALEFELYFWTYNVWDVEMVKSKIRFKIDDLFRKHEITIAFPQRDMHFKINKEEINKFNQITKNK